ncbi:MAG: protein kinase domain-containing protein [Isosphaeraceae bacterium]
MISSLKCPDEAELLAVATGDKPSEKQRQHLAGCPACCARIERVKAELALLRKNAPESAPASSTVSDPTSAPSLTNGHADHRAETTSREPGGSGGPEVELPETDRDDTGLDGDKEQPPLPAAIERYLVVGRFPRTGQAEVYRVVHPGLAKDLVLKLALRPMKPGGRHEIIEECKILAEHEHPNLVRVYDLDFHNDRPYLVMEYIRGRSLEQVAEEGHLKPRQAANLLAKVAAAADFAHRRGIVHRDIKPKNILVDERGEPRLIDFGMARLRHAWSDDLGKPGGTFAFMAPEQARIELPEEQQRVGPRSDVFALGAVLYFLLTGKPPFEGRNWRESWDRARSCDFDRKALDDPKVPGDLRRICLKAMAADPAERYSSAEALHKALERFVIEPTFLVVAVGLVGLVLFGGLAHALVPPAPNRSHSVVIPPPVPTPLVGELTIRVWSRGEGGKRGVKIDDPGALPLLAGELVHLEAKLNQPAYPYLLYLDGQGHISLLYPRQDGKFGSSPAGDLPREKVHSPEALDDGLKMQGPGGLETALLLVRRTPLPPNTDLAASIGPLPPSPLRNELEGRGPRRRRGPAGRDARGGTPPGHRRGDSQDRRPAAPTDGEAENELAV